MLAPGTPVDRYEIVELLGRGGMATVYRARHRSLGTEHALKILSVTSDAIRNRLLLEGRLQAQLRHPNIVAVSDFIEHEGVPGLVMELVRGPSLESLLAGQRFPLAHADALVGGILAGVATAHAQAVVHRDLKPGNILLQPDGDRLVPKVADFGLMKIVSPDAAPMGTRSGVAMGTPCYMSPEQTRNPANVDVRTDVFALGAIFYELVCGQLAFGALDIVEIFKRVCDGRYLDPADVEPRLPPRMAQAIRGALVVDREARIPDCETLFAVWNGLATWEAAAPSARPTRAHDIGAKVLEAIDSGEQLPAMLTILPGDLGSAPPWDPEAEARRSAERSALATRFATDDDVALLSLPEPDQEILPQAGARAAWVLLPVLLLVLGVVAWTLPGDEPLEPVPDPVAPVNVTAEPDEAAPDEPEPAAPSEPEPTEPSEPEPTAPPPPEAVAPPPAGVDVALSGSAASAWVVAADGVRTALPARLAPGRYDLVADFGERGVMPAGFVQLPEQAAATVHCDAGFTRCSLADP